LKTFKDRPDEIKELWCHYCTSNSVEIEWKVPSDNNLPISKYLIYLSKVMIKNASKPKFLFNESSKDLELESPNHTFELIGDLICQDSQ
jgi:hypothetical protein